MVYKYLLNFTYIFLGYGSKKECPLRSRTTCADGQPLSRRHQSRTSRHHRKRGRKNWGGESAANRRQRSFGYRPGLTAHQFLAHQWKFNIHYISFNDISWHFMTFHHISSHFMTFSQIFKNMSIYVAEEIGRLVKRSGLTGLDWSPPEQLRFSWRSSHLSLNRGHPSSQNVKPNDCLLWRGGACRGATLILNEWIRLGFVIWCGWRKNMQHSRCRPAEFREELRQKHFSWSRKLIWETHCVIFVLCSVESWEPALQHNSCLLCVHNMCPQVSVTLSHIYLLDV